MHRFPFDGTLHNDQHAFPEHRLHLAGHPALDVPPRHLFPASRFHRPYDLGTHRLGSRTSHRRPDVIHHCATFRHQHLQGIDTVGSRESEVSNIVFRILVTTKSLMDNQTAYFLPLSASFTEQKQQTDEINLIFLQLLLASKMGKVVEWQRVGTTFSKGTVGSDFRHFVRSESVAQ